MAHGAKQASREALSFSENNLFAKKKLNAKT